MKTVSGHRDRLVEIIMDLEPDRRPRWGRLNVPRLVSHFNDATAAALGEKDKTTLVANIDRFLALDETHTTPHPLFGTMTWRDWDHMQARHFRWHLNQFGVDLPG